VIACAHLECKRFASTIPIPRRNAYAGIERRVETFAGHYGAEGARVGDADLLDAILAPEHLPREVDLLAIRGHEVR